MSWLEKTANTATMRLTCRRDGYTGRTGLYVKIKSDTSEKPEGKNAIQSATVSRGKLQFQANAKWSFAVTDLD